MMHLKKLALCLTIFSSQIILNMDEEPHWPKSINSKDLTEKSVLKKSQNSSSSVSVRVTDEDETGLDENASAENTTISLSSTATSTETLHKNSFCSWWCCKRKKDDNLLAGNFSTENQQ